MSTSYDYVIVGGGSAGCVLANRLSADGRNSVCLVEAGPTDRNPLIRMPLGIIPLVRGWFCNWKFWSEPQAHLCGRRLYQPRGKVLGGSSAINATVYTRGHPSDYDHWAALGCEGWSYRDVLPYFIKSETFEPSCSDADRPFHGANGPLNVSERRHDNPLSKAFVRAAVQAGHQQNRDFNGARQEGVGMFHVFQKGGQRHSNARAYLAPAAGRTNLTVLTATHATRVLFQGSTAVGVRVLRKGRYQDLRATKEVILSAGTFQSPQLLMLSGIGPGEELGRHGIEVLKELPGVGANLQDHLDVIVETRARSRVGVSFVPGAWPRLLLGWMNYVFRRKGEFTSNAAEAGGFFRSSDEEAVPDIQWHFLPAPNGQHGLDLSGVMTRYGYCLMSYDLRPASRGVVGLNSADPLAPPRIDPNYAAEARDVERLVLAIRETRRVLAQPALDAHRGVEIAPGAHLQSDEELADYVRRTAEIAYHPVGTCTMGPAGDTSSVVDARLRVHGVQRLRVVDCSIMPTVPGSNTNAPATMIGEKGADMILEDADCLHAEG